MGPNHDLVQGPVCGGSARPAVVNSLQAQPGGEEKACSELCYILCELYYAFSLDVLKVDSVRNIECEGLDHVNSCQ